MLRAWAIVLLALAAYPANARAIRAPVPGNWEGRGPHGLALSFQLTRTPRGIRADALTMTFPLRCPAKAADAVALTIPSPTYGGPGAAPPGLRVPVLGRPGDIGLSGVAGDQVIQFDGRLLSRRSAVLNTAGPLGPSRACWGRTLRFRAHPAPRVAVADGLWTGTLAGADGVTAKVRVRVMGNGRRVDEFAADVYCSADDTTPRTGIDTKPAEEFIDSAGAFAGPAGHPMTVNGFPLKWNGRFAGGALTGRFSTADLCFDVPGHPPGQPLTVPFAARPRGS